MEILYPVKIINKAIICFINNFARYAGAKFDDAF